MILWLALTICGLASVSACLLCYRNELQETERRKLAAKEAQEAQEALQKLLLDQEAMRVVIAALHDQIRALRAGLLTEREQEQEAAGKLWLGSFLPDDASAAEVERTLKMAEDRALSATDPVRFSSRASSRSPSGSPREPSIQPGRRSGPR